MRAFALLALLVPLVVGAADTSTPTQPENPKTRISPAQILMADGRQAIERKDWKGAEKLLRQSLQLAPRNAHALNLLGYSLRWQGRYDESLAAYGQVFEIEPNHLGAHEYIGEAYLKLGRRADAERHLAKLRQLCGNCEEARDLASALAKAR